MLSQVDKILLSKLVTLKKFGYYVLASTLAQKIFIVIEPVIVAMAPKLTAILVHGQKEYSSFFHKISLLISIILTPVEKSSALTHHPLLSLLYSISTGINLS